MCSVLSSPKLYLVVGIMSPPMVWPSYRAAWFMCTALMSMGVQCFEQIKDVEIMSPPIQSGRGRSVNFPNITIQWRCTHWGSAIALAIGTFISHYTAPLYKLIICHRHSTLSGGPCSPSVPLCPGRPSLLYIPKMVG